MKLTKVEREKITDSVLNIQSARTSLEDVDESKVPEIAQIEDCLEESDKHLRIALRAGPLKEKS